MSEPEEQPQSEKSSADEAADRPSVLDWDACIETPPPRPSGQVKVRLHFRGRGKPIPLEVPNDDAPKKTS